MKSTISILSLILAILVAGGCVSENPHASLLENAPSYTGRTFCESDRENAGQSYDSHEVSYGQDIDIVCGPRVLEHTCTADREGHGYTYTYQKYYTDSYQEAMDESYHCGHLLSTGLTTTPCLQVWKYNIPICLTYDITKPIVEPPDGWMPTVDIISE